MPSRRALLSSLAAICVLVNAAPGLRAQQPATPAPSISASPSTAPSPNLAGIAHVALRVRDLAASVAFYEKLGFIKPFELSRDGAVYEAFVKINDRQFIELYPATPKDSQLGFLHLCFEGKDLSSVHDFYVAQGLQPNAVRTAGAGNLLFTMHGPATPTGDQNMEYTQYMPGSLHSKDFGQHLGADRIATRLVSVTLATEDPAAARAFYLTKVGFSVKGGSSSEADGQLKIPGADGATVSIVPAQALGFRSRMTLQVDSLPKAAATLKQRAIPYTTEGKSLLLMDPDGNQIVLAAGS